MTGRRVWTSAVPTLAILVTLVLKLTAAAQAEGFRNIRDVWGLKFSTSTYRSETPRRHYPPPWTDPRGRILYWNEVALAANALDHTPVGPGENRVYGEQIGPGRTARAFAIVHIAIFDAVNAIAGGYESYSGLIPRCPGASMDAAIAQAAHDTLAALFPSQASRFETLLAEDLGRVPDGFNKARGIALGAQTAAAILALRDEDGSEHAEPRVGIEFITSDEPGKWRQDPISMIPLALGAYWKEVTPFVMEASEQFRATPPPPLTSAEYAAAFNEVKHLGGDGIATPTERTAEQTVVGIAWGYDGTPGLGTPPRMFNQIVAQIGKQMGSDAVELARLLALVNVAMADAAMAGWETKYYYQFWRPIAGIREADYGTGPTGLGDGNPLTVGDPDWTPLGAQASNLTGPNFTPPFPAYISGHATFGGAVFQILRIFYGTDRIAFTWVSDEYNGVTRDNQGQVRPLIPRTFRSLSEAEEENTRSRIYLGIHWAFDQYVGNAQGRRIGTYVFKNAFRPLRQRR